MTSPEPRRRLSAAERREQLLDVALAASGDVAAVSVRELATRAGVSEGLLYHYFPTKQALVAAAVARAADELRADLQAATERGSPRERFVAGLLAYLGHVRARPVGWRALLAARTGDLADIAVAIERDSQALVLDVLGVPEPGPALLMCVAAWEAFEREACLHWLESESAPEVMVELLLATLLAALGSLARTDEQARVALARFAR